MTTGAEADSVSPTSPSTSNPPSCLQNDKNVETESLKELMFQHILGQSNVFYKSQQRGEADLSNEDKHSILTHLFANKPITFLERYHTFVKPDFLSLFDKDDETEIYFKKIVVAGKKASKNSIRKADSHIRNLRFAAMKKLQKEGVYFSNEKMQERDPMLFDLMVGKYLEDHEKLYLRPTVDVSLTNGKSASTFTGLLDRWSDAMISQRGRGDEYGPAHSYTDSTDRFLSHVDMRTTENDEEDQFQVEFDSSDDEGREEEKARQKNMEKRRNCDKNSSPIMKAIKNKEESATKKGEEVNTDSSALTDFSTMKVSANGNSQNHSTSTDLDCSPSTQPNLDVWSSGDEDETKATGIPKEDLFAEFVSMMEQRFLDGKDARHFDYSTIDEASDENTEFNSLKERDLEDAYFDDD